MFDYLDISNPFFSGYINEQENKERASLAYYDLKNSWLYDTQITKRDIDETLNKYQVDYLSLDREGKNWFNEFDI